MTEYAIKIHCNKCRALLYKYKKQGGGKLIKCYIDMIQKDYTNGDLMCHKCKQYFARKAVIRNRPAHKIIQGKIYVKGHHG